jgi:NADH-quinone oxidoreductase subunit J
MSGSDWVFVVAGLASAASAVFAVTRRNPLHSALGLLVTMIGLAAIFYLFSAPFLAMMQIAVYAGAILVLFLFVIMLINLRPEDLKPEAPLPERGLALLVVLLLFGVLAAAVLVPAADGTAQVPAAAAGQEPFGSLEGVGEVLFGAHVVPFELLSILIVAAIVAAVLLAKRKLGGG